MKIKLVVFDIAGTTLKDDKDVVANCFTEALRLNGVNIENEEMNKVMGYRKIDAITMVLKEHKIEFSEDKVEHIHQTFLDLINNHYSNNSIEEIEGASDVFKALRSKGIKVALNTGFSRSTTDIIIERMGWAEQGLIDMSITSDEVEEGRPFPFMIEKIKNELGISNPDEVAKIGDTPSDLLEGKNAHCGLTIGVLYGTHTKAELEEYPHDYLIEHISEIEPLVLER